jgi:superfamily II DNA/RNA helicase
MTDKTVKHDRDEAVPEFMNDIVDDLEYIPRNGRLGRAGRLKRKRNAKWLLSVASGVLILLVVLAIAFDNEEKPARGAADSLETALVQIEKRLEALETKIARFENSIDPRLHEKKATSIKSKPQKDYHTVQPGDNLSAIATKYGLTVDMLCKLNQLTADKPIKPDQKLLVSPN